MILWLLLLLLLLLLTSTYVYHTLTYTQVAKESCQRGGAASD
eukprot:COSAG06_NODE_6398_length_2948_cov_1.639523_4_plen_42_part_00